MKKPWFKAKKYGWGWQPSSWQGWLVLILFFGFSYWRFWQIDLTDSASQSLRPFLFELLGLVFVLILICVRTGEKPHWQWGDKKWGSANDDLNKDI